MFIQQKVLHYREVIVSLSSLFRKGLGREKASFFFLEKQKQAVLLTVIDKAGRKKIYDIYFEVDKYR